MTLLAADGPIGQRQLGRLMAIDQSTLVHMLNPLEAEQLIERSRDTDRRRHIVSITAAGHRRLHDADRSLREADARFFAALAPGERDHLHALLRDLRPDPPDADAAAEAMKTPNAGRAPRGTTGVRSHN